MTLSEVTQSEMTLALDTSLAACAAALVGAKGEVLGSRSELIQRGHAERLAPMVAEMLAPFHLGDLARVVVTKGPGSFTGLRVALSFAQGLTSARPVPLLGISSLEAFAIAEPRYHQEPILVMIDARHGRVFCQYFPVSPDESAHPLVTPSLQSLESVLDLMGGKSLDVITNEAGLVSLFPESWQRFTKVLAAPSMEALALAASAMDAKDYPAEPLYLRQADIGQSKRPNLVRVS